MGYFKEDTYDYYKNSSFIVKYNLFLENKILNFNGSQLHKT